jgi:cell division transport system ATP-binding protein
LIQLSGLDVRHHEHVVLSDIHLEVRPGELVYLVGRTGSGKSSLLRTLYGDLSLSSGECRVCDVDLKMVTPRNVHVLRRKLGMVFQEFGLLEDRSVDDNLLFALNATGWTDSKAKRRRIEEVLTAVGLEHKGYKLPYELSGGEQQRVAIARALLNDPPLLLADEPTGNLDPDTTEDILNLLHALPGQGKSLVMATHDWASMDQRPGRVWRCQDGVVHDQHV